MQEISKGSQKVAVVGTGSAGFRHLQALKKIKDVIPIAIPYREERRHELERLGFLTSPTLGDAVKEWDLSFCIVASDTSRHLPDSLAALSYGLHTLVEKPICVDAFQAKQVCIKAEEEEREVFVACVLRFSESLRTFRFLQEEIGQVISVRIECQSYLPKWRPDRPYKDSYSTRPGEGGVLLDLIHEIDYAGWLFGWPVTIQARLGNTGRLEIDVEETADLLWSMPGGGLVSMRLDYVTNPARRRMCAYGEHGTLEWDAIRNCSTLFRGDGTRKEVVATQSREDMFEAQARAFLSASKGIFDEQLASGLDGLKALAVCDAARRAELSRREEPVEYL